MPDYDVNFRIIKLDEDASEIKDYALKENEVFNIFIEHEVDEVNRLVDIPICVIGSEVGQSSEAEVNDKGKGVDKGKRSNDVF